MGLKFHLEVYKYTFLLGQLCLMMICIIGTSKGKNTNYVSCVVLDSDGSLHENGKVKHGQRFGDMWYSCWITCTC